MRQLRDMPAENVKKTARKTRILVADDYALFREIIKRLVAGTSDMIVAGEVMAPWDICAVIDNGDFDIIVLDTVISGRSGFDILREIKRKKPFFPVLILSTYFEDIYERSALLDGADGYVRKDKMADQLVGAIKAIMNGEKYFNHSCEDSLARRYMGQ